MLDIASCSLLERISEPIRHRRGKLVCCAFKNCGQVRGELMNEFVPGQAGRPLQEATERCLQRLRSRKMDETRRNRPICQRGCDSEQNRSIDGSQGAERREQFALVLIEDAQGPPPREQPQDVDTAIREVRKVTGAGLGRTGLVAVLRPEPDAGNVSELRLGEPELTPALTQAGDEIRQNGRFLLRHCPF